MPSLHASCNALHRALAAAGAIGEVLKIRARALVGLKLAQRTSDVDLERGFALVAIRAAAKARTLWLSDPGVSKYKTSSWRALADNPGALERYLAEPGVPTLRRALIACTSARRANAGPGRLPAFGRDERYPDSAALALRLDRFD